MYSLEALDCIEALPCGCPITNYTGDWMECGYIRCNCGEAIHLIVAETQGVGGFVHRFTIWCEQHGEEWVEKEQMCTCSAPNARPPCWWCTDRENPF